MGGFPNRAECKASSLPDLQGKTVADLGGYDGHMASRCLERGAAMATVVDNQQYNQYEGYHQPLRNPRLKWVDMDILRYRTKADVVLCFDVIYHSKVPYRLAEHLWHLTKETLCLSTRVVPGNGPTWTLYWPREIHPDPTVFWKPTLNGLNKLLEVVGFNLDDITYSETPGTYEPDGLVVGRWKK